MRELLADLINIIFSFFVWALLLRLIFQLVRTNFRNPLAQAVVKLTNFLVIPLRRVLPPIGGVDTASVVALLLTEAAGIALSRWIIGFGMPSAAGLLIATVLALVRQTILFLLFATIIWVVLSWIVTDQRSPAGQALSDIVEPLLRPIRRILPRLEGLDLSPMVLCVLLVVLLRLLNLVAV
jgi:YggT family protein